MVRYLLILVLVGCTSHTELEEHHRQDDLSFIESCRLTCEEADMMMDRVQLNKQFNHGNVCNCVPRVREECD